MKNIHEMDTRKLNSSNHARKFADSQSLKETILPNFRIDVKPQRAHFTKNPAGRISYYLILFQYNDYIQRVSEESDIYIATIQVIRRIQGKREQRKKEWVNKK